MKRVRDYATDFIYMVALIAGIFGLIGLVGLVFGIVNEMLKWAR
jgi:hypothetical protein